MAEEPIGLYQRVTLELIGETNEILEVVFVADASANFALGLLGESTPLARTVLGARAGQTLEYRQGDLKAVHILAVADSADIDPRLAAQQRRAEAARTQEEIAARNAAAFAASFSGKWGDYDPDGVERWQDQPDEPK